MSAPEVRPLAAGDAAIQATQDTEDALTEAASHVGAGNWDFAGCTNLCALQFQIAKPVDLTSVAARAG